MGLMQKVLRAQFAGTGLLTGLPEYRNGGLLVDTGLLTLKDEEMQRGLNAYRENAMVKGQPNMEVVPLFATDDDVIIEWRAVTVGFLDDLLVEVNGILGLSGADKLTLPQMLEAGTWKVSSLFNLRVDGDGVVRPTDGSMCRVEGNWPRCRDRIRRRRRL